MFIYFWDRESMNRGGSEEEGDTESETGSRLWAASTEPDAGLELTDCEIMTRAEVGRLTDQATQAPLNFLIFIYFWERETEREWGEREADTESEAGSRLWAASTEPNTGLKLTSCEIMTWAEVWRLTNWAIQVPHPGDFYNNKKNKEAIKNSEDI